MRAASGCSSSSPDADRGWLRSRASPPTARRSETVGQSSVASRDSLGEAELWVVPNPSGLNAHHTVATLAEAYAEPARAAGILLPDATVPGGCAHRPRHQRVGSR